MTADERKYLHELSAHLTYESIVADDLHNELSNDEWDALAETMAVKVDEFIRGLLDDEWARVEAEQEAKIASAEGLK